MVPIVVTLYAGDQDYRYRLEHGTDGVARLRQRQIQRMAQEALDQGFARCIDRCAFTQPELEVTLKCQRT